jgi:apolipoprotein N-acyltransferase
LVWAVSKGSAVWRGPLALVITAVPPIGIIGWASPLTAAGILFPGTKWFGLIGTMALSGMAVVAPKTTLCAALIGSTAVHAIHHRKLAPPADWEAVNTQFGGAGFGPRDPLSDFAAAQRIQARALESHARVIVFPESAVPRWNEATELFWQPTLALLKASGKTIILGAGVSKTGTDRFDNVLLIRGAQNGPDLPQRIPVPIGMWRPGTASGVPVDLWASGTVHVGGERAAVLICYEQLLVWPMLMSATEHPTLIIGIANEYWAVNTRIPAVQKAAMRAWAQLFWFPYVRAINR